MNIKVICKDCRWVGQAIVGKRVSRYSHKQGFPLDKYRCPVCGGGLKRGKGTYNDNSKCAVLKK